MVSVIVPVYQVSEYVERCIRSVMAQSYQDLECIIVDDCTIDDSIKKCEELIRTYDGPVRFRMIHHDHNRGLSAARNTGTHEAKGDYLFYLDSDDYIAPDCIEKLVSAVLDDPTIEMVQGNCKMTDGSTESLLYRLDHSIKTLTNEDARKEFYNNRNIYISVWNRLLKRSFVEEHHLYFREGIVFEDLLWVFYLMKYLRKACLCEDITYYYCLRQGSILVEAKPESVRCYPIMFNEILQNLTIDHEREEINGYLYYFIKRYVSYVKVVSEFKETIRLYEAKAKQHGCWYVCLVLTMVAVISHFGNPMEILKKMNSVRWRIRGKSS